jgi:hypothetical protein
MARPSRYAACGALAGASLGALAAALLAFGTGAYALEVMAVFIAPPFGWLVAYPIGAATGLGPVGRVLWAGLTPAANWALVGLLIGTMKEIRVRNREMRAVGRDHE